MRASNNLNKNEWSGVECLHNLIGLLHIRPGFTSSQGDVGAAGEIFLADLVLVELKGEYYLGREKVLF